MADATNYIKDQLINWLVDGQSFDSPPSNIYVALHTGPPGDDAANNEVTAGGYSRYSSSIPGDWTIPATGDFENSSDFIFEEATEDWGSISHFSIWDGANATDNPIAQDSIFNSVTINDGDAPVFRSGNLTGTFE
jgi:hypothetical protein